MIKVPMNSWTQAEGFPRLMVLTERMRPAGDVLKTEARVDMMLETRNMLNIERDLEICCDAG